MNALGDAALGWKTNRTGRGRAGRMLADLNFVVVLGLALVWMFA
jgi:hypothetical protein